MGVTTTKDSRIPNTLTMSRTVSSLKVPAATSRRLSSSGQYKKRLLQKYQEEQEERQASKQRSSSSPPPSATVWFGCPIGGFRSSSSRNFRFRSPKSMIRIYEASAD